MNTVKEFLKAAIVTDRQLQNQFPQHYSFFNLIEVRIQEAWNSWPHEITSAYFEGSEKPEEPTPAFELDWIEDSDLEADGFDLSWVEDIKTEKETIYEVCNDAYSNTPYSGTFEEIYKSIMADWGKEVADGLEERIDKDGTLCIIGKEGLSNPVAYELGV